VFFAYATQQRPQPQRLLGSAFAERFLLAVSSALLGERIAAQGDSSRSAFSVVPRREQGKGAVPTVLQGCVHGRPRGDFGEGSTRSVEISAPGWKLGRRLEARQGDE
jgi:hypothetical protein